MKLQIKQVLTLICLLIDLIAKRNRTSSLYSSCLHRCLFVYDYIGTLACGDGHKNYQNKNYFEHQHNMPKHSSPCISITRWKKHNLSIMYFKRFVIVTKKVLKFKPTIININIKVIPKVINLLSYFLSINCWLCVRFSFQTFNW